MFSISSCVGVVEACPSSSTPAIPQDIPYGLSGYGGIPKVSVNTDPLSATTHPSSTTPFQSIVYPFLITHHHYHHSPHHHQSIQEHHSRNQRQVLLAFIDWSFHCLMVKKTPLDGSTDESISLKVGVRWKKRRCGLPHIT
jgi:hypothetical protein